MSHWLARLAVVLAAAMSLGGCSLFLGSDTTTITETIGSGCSDVPGGACQEQIDRLTAAHPGLRSLEIACRIAACTRAGGAGSATIVLADGRTITEAWSYTGDPNPLPAPTCTGLGLALCRGWAASAADDVAPSRHVRAIAVTCTAATCTDAAGDTSIVITFADGSQQTSGMGWSGGTPFGGGTP